MKQPIYYTIIIGKRSCTVRYAVGPAYEVQALAGAFADPGEASQEFQKAVQGKPEYLSELAFLRRVETLSFHYQQDLLKLAAWNGCQNTREREEQ